MSTLGIIFLAAARLFALDELESHLEQMTGHRPAPGAYVVTADAGEGDGFTIVKTNGVVTIRGESPRGALYGVYELLERFGGCGWYAPWRTVVPKCAELKVPEGTVISDRPAFTWRQPSWYGVRTNRLFAARCRMNAESPDGAVPNPDPKYGGYARRYVHELYTSHTHYVLISPEEHYKRHPEWFGLVGGKRLSTFGQLCTSNPEVIEEAARRALEMASADPGAKVIGVSQMDWGGVCECPRCRAILDEEGTGAGLALRFVNAVAERIERVRPDLTVETLIYSYTIDPPKHVRPRKNVMLCCCVKGSPRESFVAPKLPVNRKWKEAFEFWTSCCGDITVWDYTPNFHMACLPFPDVRVFAPNMRYYHSRGARGIYMDGQPNPGTDFGDLKCWMIAKLAWNPHQSAEALQDRFLRGCYGAGAPFVRQILDMQYAALDAHPDCDFNVFMDDAPDVFDDDYADRAVALWNAAERAVADDPDARFAVRMGKYPAVVFKCLRTARRARPYVASRQPERFRQTPADRAALADELAIRREAAARGIVLRHSHERKADTFVSNLVEMLRRAPEPQASDRVVLGFDAFIVRDGAFSGGVWNEKPRGTKIVDDPTACAKRAVVDTSGALRYPTAELPLYLLAHDDVAYRVRMRLKAERIGAEDGEVARVMVWDARTQTHTNVRSVRASELGDGWTWIDCGAITPRDSRTLRLFPATPGSPIVAKTFAFDSAEFVREPDAQRAIGAFDPAQVTIETKMLKLVINSDATAKSLILKSSGEECLEPREGIPVFASTQTRPFNNETRLVQQVKRTTYPANRIRREGDLLRLAFETAPYEVLVKVTETDAGYVAFQPVALVSNTSDEHQYYHWHMDVPPIDSFRLLQLPIKNRQNFGDWLNVMWDEKAVVGVMGGTPYMDVDNEKRWGFRRLTVESLRDYGVTNGIAVLAVAPDRERFLDQVDAMERDLKLPRGVAARRSSLLNASLFWTDTLSPDNLDEHIRYAKQGGFRMMLIYYPALVKTERNVYRRLSEYVLKDCWTPDTLRAALAKIRAAGILPGLHTLQTFVGFDSKYITPEADRRLALVKHFTLAKPISASENPDAVYVEENPIAAPIQDPKCRILKFGTELMTYESYTTTWPYKFTDVRRRHLGTYAKDHPLGEIGGVLGVSECGAVSGYVDQNTSLQDEIGAEIAKIYDLGMGFLYFDGSEDVNVPCTVNIPLSQYRVAMQCRTPVLFTEGCAKSHFGWHLQSGANAFDIFPPEIFKEKILEYPYAAAQRLAKDFTRVDFGWWAFRPEKKDGRVQKEGLWWGDLRTIGTQADLWEFGTSKAAAFDCPATMQMSIDMLKKHKRTADILETVRRWEDVRARNWLTPEQKRMLRDPKREFHLLKKGPDDYELVEWKQLDVAGGKWTDVRAYVYACNGKRTVAYWHISDKATLVLPKGLGSLEAENMKTWITDLSEDEIVRAFAEARISNVKEN